MTQEMNGLNRRDMLKAAGIAAAGLLASPLLGWAADNEGGKNKKILFFTKSSGFQHDVVKRKHADELSFAEKFMMDFGMTHGFDVHCTKDGGVFTEQGLEPFDVIMFYTTGDLTEPGTDKTPPMPKEGKELFLKLISEGKKGFLGLHCASDTFHSHGNEIDPYIKMLGGEFEIHHNQEKAKIIAADSDWPPIKGLESFEKNEEWYILKNLSTAMHVLLIQDTKSMTQESYNKLGPYPETWARMDGKGKVFYSSMGHREDVWESDQFHKVLLGGLNWVAGNIEAEAKPNFEQATPGAMDRAIKPDSA